MLKKIFNTSCVILLSFFTINNSYANLDTASKKTVIPTYECSEDGIGKLKVSFSIKDRGEEYSFFRTYLIDRPGQVFIGDSVYKSIGLGANYIIPGCGPFTIPDVCNSKYEKINWNEWTFHKNKIKQTFEIETNLGITKDGEDLFISGTGAVKIKGFDTEYNSIGKNIKLSFSNTGVTLFEDGNKVEGIIFENKTYLGELEYKYDFSSNNKKINLIRKIYKRTGTGTMKSSDNIYDSYSSIKKINEAELGSCSSITCRNECLKSTACNYTKRWGVTSVDPNKVDRDYNDYMGTGLDYWKLFATSTSKTTTKVRLYPIEMTFNLNQYSNDSSLDCNNGNFSPDPNGPNPGDDLNLDEEDVEILPEFGGIPKFNGNNSTIFATGGLIIKGLEYKKVGGIQITGGSGVNSGTEVGIDKIEIYFGLEKKGQKIFSNENIKKTIGEFPSFNINSDILKTVGEYTLEFKFFSNGNQVGFLNNIPLKIIPNNILQNNDRSNSYSNKKANGIDIVEKCYELKDGYENDLSGIKTGNDIKLTIKKGIFLNQIDNNGEALEIKNKRFENDNFCFDLVSYAPTISGDLKIKVEVPKHNINSVNSSTDFNNFDIIDNALEFLPPIFGELKSSINGIDYNAKPTVGKDFIYKIKFTVSGLVNYVIETIKENENFKVLSDGLGITKLENKTSSGKQEKIFSARIIAVDEIGDLLKAPILETTPIVTVNFPDKIAKYIIRDNNNNYMKLSGKSQENTGFRVIGNIQGSGYPERTGGEINFSDMTSSNLRGTIKQKISEFTNGMKINGEIVNKIKYISGDINLPDSDFGKYQTLVVKNGNVIIEDDIKENIGIIVLREDNSNSNLGNIYIKPNVVYIKALIYADGSLESVDKFGKNYITSNGNINTRNTDLNKQLIIEGSTFTRNTIGGVDIKIGDNYRLPGGALTTNLEKAQRFDLAHLREGNEDWLKIDVNGNGEKDDSDGDECNDNNDGYSDNFIIKYNYETLKGGIPGFGE